MFYVNDDMSIYVTRGDTVFFSVTADDNGKNYMFQPGDVVRIKVTEKKACENVMFQKDFPVTQATERVDILLTEEETKIGEVISKPTDYWYEIELNPYTNPQTIVGYDDDGAKIFKLFPEGRDLEPTPVTPEDIPVVDNELSLTSDRPVQNQAIARAVVGLSEDIKYVRESGSERMATIEGKLTAEVSRRSEDVLRLAEDIAVERARINNLVANAGDTDNNAELIDVRTGADGTTYATAGEAVRGQVGDLKNEKIDKNGVGQVTAVNIEGVDIVDGTDLFPLNIENGNGSYYATGTTISFRDDGAYANFKYVVLPVKANTKYTFNGVSRWWILTDTEKNVLSSYDDNSTSVTTISDGFLYVTYSQIAITTEHIMIGVGDSVKSTEYTTPSWAIPNQEEKTPFCKVPGSISNQQSIIIENTECSLKKGDRVVFSADINTFSSIVIGFSGNADLTNTKANYITITEDKVKVKNTGEVEELHGLTIKNNIQVIVESYMNHSAKITVVSNGELYSHDFLFTRNGYSPVFALSVGSELSNCVLSWTCTDINKDIWMFGDSYFSYYPERWTYYFHEYGYDKNVLMDGFAGESSYFSWRAFRNLLKYGTPKKAVWCLGMNDGSDTDVNNPSSNWVTGRDMFLQLCEENNIEPIFATIPNVPGISHVGKNNWIRNSGYRYIDFCSAVGADVTTSWYERMLDADNVHPSVNGAKALFTRVLQDIPDIMIN